MVTKTRSSKVKTPSLFEEPSLEENSPIGEVEHLSAQQISRLFQFLQAKGYIHLFDGEKGGVGKSLICSTFVQWLLDREYPFYLLEADRSNPDLARKYRRIARRNDAIRLDFAIFSDDPNKTQADQLIEKAKERPVVVSLPAQVETSLTQWLDAGLDTADRMNIKFCRWFVTTGSYESLNLLRLSLKQHGDRMQYAVVRNGGLNEDWSVLNPSQLAADEDYSDLPELTEEEKLALEDPDEAQGETEDDVLRRLITRRDLEIKQILSLIRKYEVPIIDFPRLWNRERFILDAYNLTFKRALTSTVFESNQTSLTRLQKFLTEAYKQFEASGLLPYDQR